MNHAGSTDSEVSRPGASPMFEAFAAARGGYSEAFASPGGPRGHWKPLLKALEAMGPAVLDRRQERVRRIRHADGATFNPFDDAGGKGTPWALESIPLPITPDEWEMLEAGVVQRALLLDRILADVYGPQHLVRNGGLPPELVFANPRFLRPCHGIRPAGERYLTFYAADLVRGADGRFRVFRDCGGSPEGLGYALENRIVMSRVFSDLYHRSQIHRLAPFFQTFHRSLVHRASRLREEPGVVLLSPGPDSRIYFEHALLSRYLGYPLVEGQDLTVRNGELFLKKLAGLEPVEGIFRHIEDGVSDPFGLRRETGVGVAGLLQVLREGSVEVVNPIGSGFVDTPALASCLPVLCRELTGEGLRLENHPSWWCGTEEGLATVLARRDRLVVGPAMERGPGFSPPPSAEAIRSAPYAYVGSEPLRPSEAPGWGSGGVRPRLLLIRVFACAEEGGIAVMPGGLAIAAGDVRTLTGGVPELQHSKDVWVLSDRPVVPFSLMGGLQSVAAFRRDSDLPSRVADHLLWLGRYLERAEGLVRLLRSVFRRISGEARPSDVPELPFLLGLLRSENRIPPEDRENGDIPRYRELCTQLDEALYRGDRPESVAAVLDRVREAARSVRDRLSPDAWRVINRLEDFADNRPADPLERFDDTLFTLSAFSGLAMESMTRGLGWRFMDIGRRLERAINQAGIVRIGLSEVCTGSRNVLEALLEVFDSIMTYRARYRTVFQPAPVLDLLILDESNPKALAFQVRRLTDHLEQLPQEGTAASEGEWKRTSTELLETLRRMGAEDLRCYRDGAEMPGLGAFLESAESGLKELARRIGAHYLTRVPSTPHFSAIPTEPGP